MLRWPVEPMRAAGTAALPTAVAAPSTVWEPKFDGFRALAWVREDTVRLQSRVGKDLTRYFPDVCQALAEHLPAGVILDGELISWDTARGRTSFGYLQRRITAGRGLPGEVAARPAHFVAFDLLQDTGGREFLDQPLSRRRHRLQQLLADGPPQLPICPQTDDQQVALSWFTDLGVTGCEGLLIKNTQARYRPGKVGWVKVKTKSTTEYVVGGLTGTIAGPGSLLLGRFDRRGVLRFLGQTHPLRAAQRRELTGLQPMMFTGEGSGHPWPCPLPAAWSVDLANREPVRYTQVEPSLVAEVETDTAADGPLGKLRHRAKYLRIRSDLQPGDVSTL